MTAAAEILEPAGPRVLPRLTDDNRDFWTSGATGRLRVPRCRRCHRWVLPPNRTCPACGGPTAPEPVSGRATLYTWTVNQHQFHPEIPPPTLIAIVTLVEQDDLRLATNLVRVQPEDLRAGLALEVLFERNGDVYYPLFTPTAGAPG